MSISETETVIKKIVPYLQRRGYDLDKDLRFEEATDDNSTGRKGFIDISITCGKKNPIFLIEAKKDGIKISKKHIDQAVKYGVSVKCLLVAITNGSEFYLYNTKEKKELKINGISINKIPRKEDLVKIVVPQLKKDPSVLDIKSPKDRGLPFRPGLPLSKLNHLIKQCHNTIRKIEKNEEHAFSDFSKILFLKLLEEKWDSELQEPPYSYSFHELSQIPKSSSDQVKNAINSMISIIKEKTSYGEVLNDPIKLKKNEAYLAIVQKVGSVSWQDCGLDSKGAAFEYFVRATLKGKKLGQYFTPRPLVDLMLYLGRYEQILENVKAGIPFKVLDPACGTGGFLVHAMQRCIFDIEALQKRKILHKTIAEKAIKSLRTDTFFGVDANEGVACSAKMNMIVAGDGHSNIQCKDSLKDEFLIPEYDHPTANAKSNYAQLILSNPPFGTSESDSLTKSELSRYPIKSTKGQSLFIQQMIMNTDPGSRIVTVIDEGVLNTATYKSVREYMLKNCTLEYVISLPDETFKPNKINVKSSVLVLLKRDSEVDLDEEYPIAFIKLKTLGYDAAGIQSRGFIHDDFISEVMNIDAYKMSPKKVLDKNYLEASKVFSSSIYADEQLRFDYKYWNTDTITEIERIKKQINSTSIKDLNTIETQRGKSPSASEYVSEDDGFALVVKAGTNVSKFGELLVRGDFVEEQIYNEFFEKKKTLKDGDLLISSTGDGTLGKSTVFREKTGNYENLKAIADGHVTVVRVNQKEVYPEYLCDFIRRGFGATQVNRLFTGATGLIEIQPDEINKIIIPPLPKLSEQKKISNQLRKKEQSFLMSMEEADEKLSAALNDYYVSSK